MKYPAWLPVTNEASHSFVPSLVGERAVILDLGANMGEFHDAILGRFTPEQYIAVEPTPDLAKSLTARGFTVVEAAVAQATGPVSFAIDANSEASSIFTGDGTDDVDGVTYADLLHRLQLDSVDLVKMDIEGAELFALGDSDDEVLKTARQITVEFHDFNGILTAHQVHTVVARMRQIGFNAVRFSTNNTDWLFVRRDGISTSLWLRVSAMAWLRRSLHRARWFRRGSVPGAYIFAPK
jgi:FkbM family methyltransferase